MGFENFSQIGFGRQKLVLGNNAQEKIAGRRRTASFYFHNRLTALILGFK